MNSPRLHATACGCGLALLLLLSGCAVVSGSTFDSVIAAQVDARQDDDSATEDDDRSRDESIDAPLRVVSEPENARVYVDGRLRGSTPIDLESIEPGTHLLVVEKDGYYELRRWVDVPETGTVVIDVELEQITGFIDVVAAPADATVLVDANRVDDGFAEAPIGTYTVEVRRFGYRPHERKVRVRADEMTRVRVDLEPAPFDVSDFSAWRSAFNPQNPGRVGTTLVSYEVSAPGDGELVIRDESDTVVARVPQGPYRTWEQEYRWDGTDDRGRTVPDGTYELTLTATGDDGRYEAASTTVRVDRSLVVRFRSIWSATPGLLYAPTRSALPASRLQVSAQVAGVVAPAADRLVARFPGRVGVRIGMGAGVELFGYGGFLAHSEPMTDRAAAGGALSWEGLSTRAGGATLGAGIAAGGAWRTPGSDGRHAGPDSQASFPGVFVSLPLSARMGVVSVVLAPEYRLTPAEVTYAQDLPAEDRWGGIGYLRSGVLLDSDRLSVGASAAFRTTRFADGCSLDLPFQVGLEAHWIVPGSSVAVSAITAAEIESPHDFYAIGGAGIGVLF
ncbi:MAG: PEGA domain-containing protein [Spirochaetota bacterium]